MKRIIFDICIFLSLFYLPWWITLLAALIGIFIFQHFYEFLFTGLLMYALYGIGNQHFYASSILLPIILITVYFLGTLFKKSILFYKT